MATNSNKVSDVLVIGAGFTGLSAAYELSKKGINVTVLEAESEIAGLAAAFDVAGEKLDRFYHHWFTNDSAVMNLIAELQLNQYVSIKPSNTGIYYANHFFKLSTPWDLLKFKPLKFLDRVRLGLLTLKARRVKNWRELENISAKEWLQKLGGEAVYRTVWEPLLVGKFGPYADEISAVWFWNKLKLRGGSRDKAGSEQLAYFRGGFVALAQSIADHITNNGGEIILNHPVLQVSQRDDIYHCHTPRKIYKAKRILFTTALPLIAEMIKNWAERDYIEQLLKINYIGNVCLVMELKRSLSNTYWLNVNDPSFPFVGVIEHTNFESTDNYGGRHIVYLSKYLPPSDPLYMLSTEEFFEFSFPYLQKMFPEFQRDWIITYHLWRARWSQPVVEKNYSQMIPSHIGPNPGLFICSMAQIYPEDRGTNYAIREGRKIGNLIAETFEQSQNDYHNQESLRKIS